MLSDLIPKTFSQEIVVLSAKYHGTPIDNRLGSVFYDVWAHYSLCYPSPAGNVRGFICTTARGQAYTGKVAPFLREKREEVIVDWTVFNPNTILSIICKYITFYTYIFYEFSEFSFLTIF